MATTITVNKSLPTLPDVKLPPVIESASDINKKVAPDKEWTEPRIHLKDLHQHYLKLTKSRLTSKYIIYIYYTKICNIKFCIFY